MKKLLIEISGGTIQSIKSTEPLIDIDVKILDWDDKKEILSENEMNLFETNLIGKYPLFVEYSYLPDNSN